MCAKWSWAWLPSPPSQFQFQKAYLHWRDICINIWSIFHKFSFYRFSSTKPSILLNILWVVSPTLRPISVYGPWVLRMLNCPKCCGLWFSNWDLEWTELPLEPLPSSSCSHSGHVSIGVQQIIFIQRFSSKYYSIMKMYYRSIDVVWKFQVISSWQRSLDSDQDVLFLLIFLCEIHFSSIRITLKKKSNLSLVILNISSKLALKYSHIIPIFLKQTSLLYLKNSCYIQIFWVWHHSYAIFHIVILILGEFRTRNFS